MRLRNCSSERRLWPERKYTPSRRGMVLPGRSMEGCYSKSRLKSVLGVTLSSLHKQQGRWQVGKMDGKQGQTGRSLFSSWLFQINKITYLQTVLFIIQWSMYCRGLFEHSPLPRILTGVLQGFRPFFPALSSETSLDHSTLNPPLPHLYHSKHFINSFVSQTSASLHPQTLSFDRLPFFAGGGVEYQTGYPSAAISAFCLPVNPLDMALTDTPSPNPLYLPLLRKKVGGGWYPHTCWQGSPPQVPAHHGGSVASLREPAGLLTRGGYRCG